MRLIASLALIGIAAIAGWVAAGFMLAEKPGAAPVYDHQVAYHLASIGVPAATKEYLQFDLNSFGKRDEQASELAEVLQTANNEKQYLGLIGSDAGHNLDVLRRAVKITGDKTVPDMTLVILGPKRFEPDFRNAATPLKAQIRYYAYP